AGDFDAVDVEVAVDDSLASLGARLRKAGSTDDIVQSPLAQAHNLVARIALLGHDHVVIAAKLLLAQAVVVLDLLLFGRGQAPVREFAPFDVHAGRTFAALQRPGRAGRFIKEHSEAAIDPRLRTVITRHATCNSLADNGFRGTLYRDCFSGSCL